MNLRNTFLGAAGALPVYALAGVEETPAGLYHTFVIGAAGVVFRLYLAAFGTTLRGYMTFKDPAYGVCSGADLALP